jgi:hypothetical protein
MNRVVAVAPVEPSLLLKFPLFGHDGGHRPVCFNWGTKPPRQLPPSTDSHKYAA